MIAFKLFIVLLSMDISSIRSLTSPVAPSCARAKGTLAMQTSIKAERRLYFPTVFRSSVIPRIRAITLLARVAAIGSDCGDGERFQQRNVKRLTIERAIE